MLSELEWEQAQQRLTVAWHKGDLSVAFAEIDQVLAQGTPGMKGQALVYRGMIRESKGERSSAKEDWVSAISYAPIGSYSRYVAERSLGELCERSDNRDEAARWYRAALVTCAEGDKFSAGLALKPFLRLRGSQLSEEDRKLAITVIEKSWGVVELSGTPDLVNLNEAAEALASKASQF